MLKKTEGQIPKTARKHNEEGEEGSLESEEARKETSEAENSEQGAPTTPKYWVMGPMHWAPKEWIKQDEEEG